MADNTTLASGTGGDTLRTDDVGAGVKVPASKIVVGADGVDGGFVSDANPLPVSDAGGTISVDDGGGIITVDGTVAVTHSTLSVVGGGAEASALRVTLANDSTGLLSVDDNGGTLSVDDGGGSITVDGTVAVTGTFWQATQPVSIASTLTVTGTGGTFPVTDSGGSLTIDNTTLAVTGGGVEASALRVTIATDSTGVLSIDDNGGSITVDGSVSITGTVAATQSGTWNIATVTTVASVTQIANALPAGTNNIGDVDVLTLPALPAGTNAIGKLAANSGVDIGDVDITSISAGTNAIGNVGLVGRTSGGLTPSKTVSGASTNATSVKASAGQVFSIFVSNINAAARYLKLYNKASAPTVGTDVPVLTFIIPGNTAGAGFSWNNAVGIAFGTGIAFALTTGATDADTGAVAANELVVNLLYS